MRVTPAPAVPVASARRISSGFPADRDQLSPSTAMPRIASASCDGSTVLGRSRPAWKRRTRFEGGAAAGLESALRAVRSQTAWPGREMHSRPNKR
jgi:hypothetical protein